MPFKSKKQQRFMYATKPKGVDLEEWAKETDFSKLPEKVRKKKKDKNKKKKDKSDVDFLLDMAVQFDNACANDDELYDEMTFNMTGEFAEFPEVVKRIATMLSFIGKEETARILIEEEDMSPENVFLLLKAAEILLKPE